MRNPLRFRVEKRRMGNFATVLHDECFKIMKRGVPKSINLRAIDSTNTRVGRRVVLREIENVTFYELFYYYMKDAELDSFLQVFSFLSNRWKERKIISKNKADYIQTHILNINRLFPTVIENVILGYLIKV